MATYEPKPQRLISAAEYARLPDDESSWDELVRGRIVREPLPPWWGPHGPVMAQVVYLLRKHIVEQGLDLTCGVHAGFLLEEEPDTVRGPDVWVTRPGRPMGRSPFSEGAPELAVEVLSPSNRPREMAEKVAQYLAAGALLVWVLNPGKRTAVVYRPGAAPRKLGADDEIAGGEVVPGFRVRVAELFRT